MMNIFLWSGFISVVLFLVDIKYGEFVRNGLLGMNSWENDNKISVGNLLFAIPLFLAVGLNIFMSVCIVIYFIAVFLVNFPSNAKVKKFLKKRIF